MHAFFPESWSLSVEEFAYIFLPFAFILAGALAPKKNRKTLFAITTFALIVLCILAKWRYNLNTQNTTLSQWNIDLKAVVIYRLDSIFIGVLFSWIFSVYSRFWRANKNLMFIFGLIMMGFFAVGVGYLRLTIEYYPFFWNVLYLPATSFSIALFLPILSEWKSEESFIRKPVTFISLISYSIYLLHYSVILQIMKQVVNTEALTTLMVVVFTLLYLSITIILSYLLYRFYERPMMERRDYKHS
jgi:peptidoglycan/LPS O-acetylase OafA/YrhL